MTNEEFMKEAIDLSLENMRAGKWGPFWAVVVKDWKIVGRWANNVTSLNDPTAHAEVMAIRDACKNMWTFQLTWCTIYTSCEPCPMCLGAIYWARPDAMYYANNKHDAANIGFDDAFIYEELAKPESERILKTYEMPSEDALKVFKEWSEKNDKIEY